MRDRWRRACGALAFGAALVGGSSPEALAQGAGPERVAGRPNLNGIWQAQGSAHWNLEAHGAAALPGFWQLGAIGAMPAGRSVVRGGTIPYRPEALAQRERNRAEWPKSDPEASCYLPGVPRATYMPYPFQIVQGAGDILFVYEYASANRIVHMSDHTEAPVDSWMGWSNGRWEGDTLVIESHGFNDRTWLDRAGNYHSAALRVTERYTLAGPDHLEYEATIDDPEVFERPWTISLPLYRRIEPNAQLLEFKCVEFSEQLLYGDLEKRAD